MSAEIDALTTMLGVARAVADSRPRSDGEAAARIVGTIALDKGWPTGPASALGFQHLVSGAFDFYQQAKEHPWQVQ